jgi:hypothetical protein
MLAQSRSSAAKTVDVAGRILSGSSYMWNADRSLRPTRTRWDLTGCAAARPVGHDDRMALLCDYFLASSDEDAASVIDRIGGPGARPPWTAPVPSHRPGLLRRRVETPPQPTPVAPAEPVFPTVSGNGIEPVVQMGTLEALLTGRTYDDVMAEHPGGREVAVNDGGERLVMRLSDELSEALADATENALAAAAVPWAQTEEFWGQGDPQILERFLRNLAGLARQARDTDRRLYCWLCI